MKGSTGLWKAGIAAFAGLALASGCAAPKVLYEGPPLPRESVSLLRGFPFMSYREGREGRGNTVSATGRVVIIGLDGRIFNRRVYAAYSGDAFFLPPGRRSLLAYCEYTPHGEGFDRVFYSELFTLSFTAIEGHEFRYQADFHFGRIREGLFSEKTVLLAEPGVWDVTKNSSADSSNRVNESLPHVPVTFRTLTHLQAAVGGL